jgi:hypothetical protein
MAAQSVHRTTADEPDQTGCHEGPTIHFDRPPAGALAPDLIGFPVWAGPSALARDSRNESHMRQATMLINVFLSRLLSIC